MKKTEESPSVAALVVAIVLMAPPAAIIGWALAGAGGALVGVGLAWLLALRGLVEA